MASQNGLQFISQVNYGLKRAYGLPLDVYHNTANVLNVESGRRDVTRIVYHIDKAIILASTLMPRIIPGGMGQNSVVDTADEVAILDFADLPADYEPNDNDYVVVRHQRFAIVKIEVFEDIRTLLYHLRQLKGQAPNEIHNVSAKSKLRFGQTVVNQ